jgi:superfamily II DNA or RNA helicase
MANGHRARTVRGLDVVSVAATGAGKTLSFWIALLMARAEGKTNAQIIVVAPLNVLGKQNEKLLNDAGIRCIAVQKGTATKQVFDVRDEPRSMDLTNANCAHAGH